jgi:hypothetical protein
MSLYVPCYRPYNKHNTNIHAPGGIRTHDPSKRAAEDPRLRPHGHWDRRFEGRIKYTMLRERLRNNSHFIREYLSSLACVCLQL